MTGDAVAAAVAVARGFGLSSTDPVVLANRSNVLVHLRPFPVVARVAGLTAVFRPGVADFLRRDVEVAGYLASRGAPVVPPCVDPPAGPHEHDGHVLTFFHYVPHDPDAVAEPERVGRMLADLHEVLRGYPGELPADGPVADLGRVFTLLERHEVLPDARIGKLRAELGELATLVAGMPGQPLHGDATPANLLVTPNGLVWNDFEDTWHGPVAWDLACLANSKLVDGWVGVAAYPSAVRAEVEVLLRLRRLYSACWPAFTAWARRRTGEGTDPGR